MWRVAIFVFDFGSSIQAEQSERIDQSCLVGCFMS